MLRPQSSHTPPLRRPVAGVAVALAPRDEMDTQRQTFERPSSATERKAADSSAQMSFWRAAAAPCVLPLLWTLPPPSLTPALVRRPVDAVGSLPRPLVVEGRAALTVLSGGVVPAHTLAVDLPFQSTDRKQV